MAKRERVEDLGRISEKTSEALDRITDLIYFVKSLKPDPCEGDLTEAEVRIQLIHEYVSEIWEIARYGDDE